MNDQKIVDRIRKLLALATSDNVNEAASAAAKAQELIERHNIDRAMLAEDKPDEHPLEDVVTQSIYDFPTSRAETWQIVIAQGVTGANGCKVYISKRGENPNLVGIGPLTSLLICSELMSWLTGEVERLLKEEESRARTNDHMRAWRNSFRVGAASTIANRLRAAKAETRKKLLAEAKGPTLEDHKRAAEAGDLDALIALDRKASEGASGYALARVETALARLDEQFDRVLEKEKSLGLKKGSARSAGGSADGFSRGREAGKRASLNAGKRLRG